jgi:hypothetical protein
MACGKIEHDIEEIGLPKPEYSKLSHYIPFLRFKKDIDFINEYLGISVTKLIIRENIINPLKSELIERLGKIHRLINRLGHNRLTYNLHLLVSSLDVRIYEYRNEYRRGAMGFRSASSTMSHRLQERRLPFFRK